MGNRVKVGDIIATPKGNGTVCMVTGGNYAVQLDNGEWYAHIEETISSPNKESKEPKFRVGDKVKTLETIGSIPKDTIGIVEKTYEDGSVCVLIAFENSISNIYCYPSGLEIVQTKEQLEEACLRQWQSELEELNKMELDKMQHPERQFTYEPAMDWVKYEAQLARDIAIEYVKINRYLPEVLGDTAVTVARSIVEGLKKE